MLSHEIIIKVDADLSPQRVLELGGYRKIDPDVRKRLSTVSGRIPTSIMLINFGEYLTTADVLIRINGAQKRPSGLLVLAAAVVSSPEAFSGKPTASLETTWDDEDGDAVFPLVFQTGPNRGLSVHWSKMGWDRYKWFAVENI